jgi:hypothetical protein
LWFVVYGFWLLPQIGNPDNILASHGLAGDFAVSGNPDPFFIKTGIPAFIREVRVLRTTNNKP